MKANKSHYAFAAVLAIFLSYNSLATVRTVNAGISGYPNPGQFNSISAAITAANAGDTIMVAGSTPYDVSGFTVSKQLTFIGAGYNPQNADHLTSIASGVVTLNASSNGSVFMGLVFNSTISSTVAISNITFRRCYMVAGWSHSSTASNILVAECVINGTLTFNSTLSNSNIKNNIFIGDIASGAYKVNLAASTITDTLDHNTFLNGKNGAVLGSTFAAGSGFLRCSNAILSNNIFYNLPVFSTTILSTCTGNYFNNNICYRSGTTLATIPQSGNFGSGNINNTDPIFTTLFSSATNVFLDFNGDNLRPNTGSPCFSTATDGTNIGATGGRYPVYLSTNTVLTGEPPVPSVRSINITSSTVISAGTPINVTVRAKKIN